MSTHLGSKFDEELERKPLKHKVTLDQEIKKDLSKAADTIRGLSIDGVQRANSGHPGLPMGCAELGAYIYGMVLKHNPKSPNWANRDRFILSAGHGSMFLYSCIHLAGFDLPIEELKNFRQYESRTPGHPEFGETEGVETTTGPLGQGVGHAVGQALGIKLLGAKFNTDEHKIFDSKVFVLCGDGCLMEGVAAEACSLAGHLRLNNLVLVYDSNNITLDGPASESFTEDVALRYKSYGWEVLEVDGHDFDEIHSTLSQLREFQDRPCLVIATTIIGKGSPNKAGTHKVHGAPLGAEEVLATKKALGLPEEEFFVPQSVYSFFEERQRIGAQQEQEWKSTFDFWAKANPELYKEFEWMSQQRLPEDIEAQLHALEADGPQPGRKASHQALNFLGQLLPQIYGGSADLSCSDLTMMDALDVVRPGAFKGRNIKYGVREFGMCTVAVGLAQTAFITPFIGTFLTFSDYMRNGIRLAALMGTRMIYQFTHDSIFLGEDGPTHQPVEHYASLRAMPGLQVIRPSGVREVRMAWLAALKFDGPTAIILSRQKVQEFEGTQVPFDQGMGRGAYIVKHEKVQADFTLVSTGSELPLAMDVATELEKRGKDVRVVSMPCWEIFEKQDQAYKDSVFGGDIGQRVAIEAGVEHGWHKYVGYDGITVTVDSFGASAPIDRLCEHFGFNVDAILEMLL